ncbi:Major sperm protein [Aphelenchoides fujianensis]|nr:Major sperm protein [Aphelenchoides fujianensis]
MTSTNPPRAPTPTGAAAKKADGAQEGTVLGKTPDQELRLQPRWIVFSSEDAYRRNQFCPFTITNTEEHTVIFRIRTRDRTFPMFSHCYGWLEPLQSAEVTVMLPSADTWPRDPSEFAGRRHKIVVESLQLPEDVQKPADRPQRDALCRRVFHETATKQPLTRVYVKLSLLLPRLMEGAPADLNRTATPSVPSI